MSIEPKDNTLQKSRKHNTFTELAISSSTYSGTKRLSIFDVSFIFILFTSHWRNSTILTWIVNLWPILYHHHHLHTGNMISWFSFLFPNVVNAHTMSLWPSMCYHIHSDSNMVWHICLKLIFTWQLYVGGAVVSLN